MINEMELGVLRAQHSSRKQHGRFVRRQNEFYKEYYREILPMLKKFSPTTHVVGRKSINANSNAIIIEEEF